MFHLAIRTAPHAVVTGTYRARHHAPAAEACPVKTLRQVKPGETVRVCALDSEGALRRRIMDMGLTRGTTVTVRKVAPLGDPIELTVRGYELSIRKSEAEQIRVE